MTPAELRVELRKQMTGQLVNGREVALAALDALDDAERRAALLAKELIDFRNIGAELTIDGDFASAGQDGGPVPEYAPELAAIRRTLATFDRKEAFLLRRAVEAEGDTALLRALGERLLVSGFDPAIDPHAVHAVNERARALALAAQGRGKGEGR